MYNKLNPNRPLTNDIFNNILTVLDCKLSKVVIDDYNNRTYYATIYLETEKKHLILDSRPSDAIALALSNDVPIYVENKIMKKYSIDLDYNIYEKPPVEYEDEDEYDDEDMTDNDEGKIDLIENELLSDEIENDEIEMNEVDIDENDINDSNERYNPKNDMKIKMLKSRLKKAIEDERYEDAAFIRDQLDRLTNNSGE